MNNEIRGQEQFSALIDSYQNLVFSICYRMTSDYFASEDLTQDTFLSAYEHLSTFDGANAKAWLCRIATNKCIDYMKRASARNIPTEDTELENSMQKGNTLMNSGPDPEQMAMDNEVKRTLLERCNNLKPPYDEIAKLYYFDELEMPEIAARKGVKLKTVQTQVYRARDMLRKAYRKDTAERRN